jgi:hypothetical protein
MERKKRQGNWNSLREINIRNGLLVVILMCGEWSKHDISAWNWHHLLSHSEDMSPGLLDPSGGQSGTHLKNTKETSKDSYGLW